MLQDTAASSPLPFINSTLPFTMKFPAGRSSSRIVVSLPTPFSVTFAPLRLRDVAKASDIPVGPVAPAWPVGPVAPAWPVGPVAPSGPVGPVAPTGPVGPGAPTGPAGPAAPACRAD